MRDLASSSGNHAARSTSGNTWVRPDRGGHSSSNVLEAMVATSRSPASKERRSAALRSLVTSRRSVGRASENSARMVVSREAAKSSGTPNLINSLLGAIRAFSVSATSVKIRRALASSRSPDSVNSMRRVVRSNNSLPTVSSRRFTCWLTVDCVRCSLSAARVKLSVSATDKNALSRSRSSMPIYSIIH